MHLSLPRRFPLFILASSVCWSFQCLISTLTQGGGGGHLFRLTCGEGGTLQITITSECGECSQCFSRTGFAPAHSVCAFMVYTAQALGCSAKNCLRWALGCMCFPGLSCSGSRVLHKGADSAGPAFCALPSPSSSGDQVLGECSCPQVGGASYHLPRPSRSVFWVYNGRTFSGVPCVSSGELISGCNPTGGGQPSRIPRTLGQQRSLLAVW